MKIKPPRLLADVWLVLSEVPGWPDAPLTVRLRRAAPILLAILAIAVLASWKFGWREPAFAAERARHAHLLALESEVAALALEWSEQQTVEIAAKLPPTEAWLLDSKDDVPGLLRQLHEEIRALGWSATFQAYDATAAEITDVPGVEFASARCQLEPIAGNPAAFSSLLGVFDRFSAANKRIDLTRLGVRADEPEKLQVELHLRIACRAPHEKTS